MRLFFILLICFCTSIQTQAQTDWQKHESPVNADLHNIFFASDSVGWIITHNTGDILRTTNSGGNWFVQTRMDSIYLEDIFFLDNKTGWISGENGLIFKTTDGGKNWTKHKIADKKSWIYGIHFFDKNIGLAVGLRENKPITIFMKTINGGKSWKNIRDKIPAGFYEPTIFLNDKEGYVGGINYILHTTDSGSSWQIQYSDTTSQCREGIRGIDMITSKQGWAAGLCGLVLHTEDGKNWTPIEKFTKNQIRSVAFTSLKEGFIAGDSSKEPGVLYRTEDAGKTWQVALKNHPDIRRITLTENKIWLVGDHGTILSKSR